MTTTDSLRVSVGLPYADPPLTGRRTDTGAAIRFQSAVLLVDVDGTVLSVATAFRWMVERNSGTDRGWSNVTKSGSTTASGQGSLIPIEISEAVITELVARALYDAEQELRAAEAKAELMRLTFSRRT